MSSENDRLLIKDIEQALFERAKYFLSTGWPPLYSRALKLYTEMIAIILRLQDRLDIKYVHKGRPYQMCATALLLLNRPEDALSYFLYAFTEDVIFEKLEKVSFFTEKGGAYYNLKEDYKVPTDTLEKLKREIYKKIDPKNPPPKPDHILDEALRQLSLDKSIGGENSIATSRPSEENWILKPYSEVKYPGVKQEKKVFLGGNYDNMVLIREVAKVIEKCGFTPHIGFDFALPPEKIYSFDSGLVGKCEQAVFEVTIGDGHLIEIERALLLGKKCILIYQVRDVWETPPCTLTSMLTTAKPKPPLIGYKNFKDLKTKLYKELWNHKYKHLNTYEDRVIIRDIELGSDINIELRDERLYCELCKAFNCAHVKYAKPLLKWEKSSPSGSR